jgi:hypothetical protein
MYTCLSNTIIIHPDFNDDLKGKIRTILKKYKRVVFSNFNCVDKYEDIYIRNKKFYKDEYNFFSQRNKIYMPSKFNKQIDHNLPENIECLELGHEFNLSVDGLPQTLKFIKFGHEFNQSIDNLPFSLNKLVLGHEFNQFVDNLPNSLISLELGYQFNKFVDDLPSGLESLVLGKLFNQNINNLPRSLVFLEIKSNYYNDVRQLPKNLFDITFSYKIYSSDDNISQDKYNSENISYRFRTSIQLY